MNLQLLGPVEATVADRPIPLGTTKQRAVLAMLALQPNATVSVDRLIDGLWGEDPPSSAPKMIQLYVSQLRRLLAGSDAEIVTHGRGYELRIPEHAVDAARLERLVDRAQGSDGAAAHEAVALWHGAALADVATEPFAPAEIRRLEELWLRATELAIDDDLAAGRPHEALAQLERLIDLHPLRERLHAQRMLALYRCGRQAEALEAYRHARRLLVEQIGAEPGPELRRLHDAVLNQDPALDAPSPAPAARAAATAPPAGRRPARRRRAVALAAGAILLAAAAVFAVTRLTAADRLPRIDANAVGAIDAEDGAITAQYAVGRGASALGAADGSVWVADRLDGTVSRIEPGRERTVVIPAGDELVGLALSPASLWVTDRGTGSVIQINLDANQVVRRIDAGNAPAGIAAGFGSVWVTSEVDRTVLRIDQETGTRSAPIELGANPTAVAAGAGAVWVASEEAGTVFRIEPRSGVVTDTINTGNGPAAIAVGAGAVWVANRQDGTVWRIDPATGSVESVRVGRDPTAIVADGGAVWVANSGTGTVSRIDPATTEVHETVDVGNRPIAIGADGGSVWVAALAAPASHRGGRLNVETDGLCCLDPAAYFWTVHWLAYDGLVGYRRTGGSTFGEIVPNLATDVPRPGPDGRTYTFTLRPGLRYSDGSPVRAGDFRAALEHVLGSDGSGAGYYDRIVGARRCAERPATCDLSRGIVTDERARTITIRLTQPDTELLHKLAVPFAYLVPARHPFGGSEPPPGTGPYVIEQFDEDRGARFVRNPHFRVWSEDARPDGAAGEIVVRLSDTQASIPRVERGDADVVQIADQFGTHVALAEVTAVATRAAGRLYTSAVPELEFMFLNVRTPPFDDVRVRRALNYAVDRRAIGELSGAPDLAQPTCQILPPGFPGYTPSCRYTIDPGTAGGWTGPDVERARRLIDRSGTRGTKVTVRGPQDKRLIIRYFAALLRRLGYDASARVFADYGAYNAAIVSGTTQIGILGFSADYSAASTFAPMFVCMPPAYRVENPSQFCDRGIAARIERALDAGGAGADALWRRVYASLERAAPVVPLVNRRTLTLVSRRVGNYAEHPLWGPLLDQLWVR